MNKKIILALLMIAPLSSYCFIKNQKLKLGRNQVVEQLAPADQNPEGVVQQPDLVVQALADLAGQNPDEGDQQQDQVVQALSDVAGQNPEGNDQPRGASQNPEAEQDNKVPTQAVVVEEEQKDDLTSNVKTDQVDSTLKNQPAPRNKPGEDLILKMSTRTRKMIDTAKRENIKSKTMPNKDNTRLD